MITEFFSALGDRTTYDNKAAITTNSGESGCPLYGPYLALPPGEYSIEFHIIIDDGEQTLIDTEPAGVVDVCCDLGTTIVARRRFSTSDITAGSNFIILNFSVENHSTYEFRVFTTGHASLTIPEELTLITDTEIDFILPTSRRPGKLSYVYSTIDLSKYRFVLDNMARFKNLRQLGAVISPTKSGALVTMSDITIHVQNVTDFQIIEEIIVRNDYNFLIKEPTCVLDIGMNVGVASLYFSALPYVQEVHSFEPFKATFDRALENFQLNPTLSHKIKPHHCGLGSGSSSTVVLYNPAASIGISIHGVDQGHSETINIKDAADVFSAIIRRAKENKLTVVAKIDCEGSEFPIFETLSAHGMLGDVSIFLIEWHKWWSTDKTQHDLIDPLLDLGFVVLDQTDAANPHAGPIYAVRRLAS